MNIEKMRRQANRSRAAAYTWTTPQGWYWISEDELRKLSRLRTAGFTLAYSVGLRMPTNPKPLSQLDWR